MHQQKYLTLNFFINEIFSVEKFPNYGIMYSTVFSVKDYPTAIKFNQD